MITRSFVAVPSMAARTALVSPSIAVGVVLVSGRRLRHLHKGTVVVGSTLEAHSSAKWEARQANKEGGSSSSSKKLESGPDSQSVAVAGGVVALGKFDALHVGHRALAEQAAELGTPFMLSFAGMAEVLGWEARLPVVARCDRARVMGLWAQHCGDMVPQEYVLDFVKVRSLSPEQFVAKMATELKVKGVVAGANYRFGYKAAGDASDLVRLCQEYGLQSAIVDPVMDTHNARSSPVTINDRSGGSREKGQVSTTRVRKALAKGDMRRVAELLGRKHRIIVELHHLSTTTAGNVVVLPAANVLNQPPELGSYRCSLVHEGAATELVVGQLRLEEELLVLEFQDPRAVDVVLQQSHIALDFLV